jgi:5-methyltetrahydrofolate--homocysteine methyltransferase
MSDFFLSILKDRPVLLDGAMGTELMKIVTMPGPCPEMVNLEFPEAVQAVHADYFQAGADAVSTNSFGASPIKLAAAGLSGRARELNVAAARLAAAVRPAGKFIAGDIGPTGKFLKPQGPHSETEFEDGFAVQAEGLAEGGADFILIETMFDLREALCAVHGARRGAPELPVLASMTFNRTRRGFFTLMGDSPEKCARAFQTEGLTAFGANCTLSSADMADLIAAWKPSVTTPLIAQANSGKPIIADGRVVYDQSEDDYLKEIPRLIENGARIIGGCCGTTPSYIRRMAALIGAL